MPPPNDPIPHSVTISLDNGAIELTTTIDPETKQHAVNCDLCGQTIKLGIRAAGNPLFQHRNSDPCQRKAFNAAKDEAKQRIDVSPLEYII